MRPRFFAMVTLLVFGGVLSLAEAQNLGNSEIEGLCIYKSQSATPDDVAIIFEYRATVSHPAASYVFPVSGSRVRLPPASEYHFIPYPGRSDLDRESALSLLETAQRRFPQFQTVFDKIGRAWKSHTTPDPKLAAGSERRHAQAGESVRKISEPGILPPPLPEPSLLTSPVLKPASLAPSPSASPKEEQTTKTSTADSLKENLEVIKSYYELTGRAAGE